MVQLIGKQFAYVRMIYGQYNQYTGYIHDICTAISMDACKQVLLDKLDVVSYRFCFRIVSSWKTRI